MEKLNPTCISCMIKRQEEGIADIKEENKKLDYFKDVLKLIYDSENTSAPEVTEKITELRESYFGKDEKFDSLKKTYNALMMKYEKDIRKLINSSIDEIYTAILFAMAGNYIDFGAMGDISDEKLDYLIKTAEENEIDEGEYAMFITDLEKAKKLVYLTDNCGEIVMDKLLIETIKAKYPKIKIDVIVRGKPVLNDATAEDAKDVGLDKIADITGNGTGIAGTSLEAINKESYDLIDNADVIISKGQGNFETLYGSRLNIYYMFLCKCDLFVKRFGLERYKGVFINDNSLAM